MGVWLFCELHVMPDHITITVWSTQLKLCRLVVTHRATYFSVAGLSNWLSVWSNLKQSSTKSTSCSKMTHPYNLMIQKTNSWHQLVHQLVSFPRTILFLFFFFTFLLIYAGLGVEVLGLGSWIGFLGLGFSVDGVWACGMGLSGVGAIYINIEE